MVPLDDCREPVFNTPEHQNLYAEVMALPAKYRLPLYLYYYEGYTAALCVESLDKSLQEGELFSTLEVEEIEE